MHFLAPDSITTDRLANIRMQEIAFVFHSAIESIGKDGTTEFILQDGTYFTYEEVKEGRLPKRRLDHLFPPIRPWSPGRDQNDRWIRLDIGRNCVMFVRPKDEPRFMKQLEKEWRKIGGCEYDKWVRAAKITALKQCPAFKLKQLPLQKQHLDTVKETNILLAFYSTPLLSSCDCVEFLLKDGSLLRADFSADEKSAFRTEEITSFFPPLRAKTEAPNSYVPGWYFIPLSAEHMLIIRSKDFSLYRKIISDINSERDDAVFLTDSGRYRYTAAQAFLREYKPY